ncbi:MAG: hypothetical protein C0596_00835 [Marinilabiliales bacterium]|nr:MAG: hypothetical protein C0596_00835 [Marinilabiliales bacterium]
MSYKSLHNKYAPYWAIAMLISGFIGLAPLWFDVPSVWSSYGLDAFGPAWNYILFRGLFTVEADNKWTRFWTPIRTFLVFIFFSFSIEILQYFEVYDSTFDPLDLLAYCLVLIPVFIIDFLIVKKNK